MSTSDRLMMTFRISLPDNQFQPTHIRCAAEASARIQKLDTKPMFAVLKANQTAQQKRSIATRGSF